MVCCCYLAYRLQKFIFYKTGIISDTRWRHRPIIKRQTNAYKSKRQGSLDTGYVNVHSRDKCYQDKTFFRDHSSHQQLFHQGKLLINSITTVRKGIKMFHSCIGLAGTSVAASRI